jgi:hypothetical protein
VKSAIQQARDSVKELVASCKEAIESVKNEIKQAIADVKNAMEQVKENVKSMIGGFNELKKDIKEGFENLKKDAKKAGEELKKDFNELKKDFKEDVNELKEKGEDFLDQAKQFYKKSGQQGGGEGASDLFGAGKHVKDAASGKKEIVSGLGSAANQARSPQQVAGGLPLGKGQGPGLESAVHLAKGGASQAGGLPGAGAIDPMSFQRLGDGGAAVAPLAQSAAPGQSPLAMIQGAAQGAASAGNSAPSAIAQSAIVTRAGGFGGEGMAQAINATSGATFLQSPSEGQLMIVRTQSSLPLSPSEVSSQVVDHQMNGLSSSDAFASVLKQKGYAVYERPWEGDRSEFLLKAVL